MLRVVLVVVLTTALLGVAMPTVEDAREAAARETLATQLDRLDRTAQRLLERNDVPPPGVAGPRRVVTLSLPGRTWGNAGLDWLWLPAANDTSPTWQVRGGSSHVWRPSAPIIARENLTIRDGGRIRLVLTARRTGAGPAVVVSRPAFMPDGATSPTHAASSSGFGTTLHVGQ